MFNKSQYTPEIFSCFLRPRFHTVRWTEHWLNGQINGVVLSSAKSCWGPITSRVPQGSILGSAPFKFFSNYLDSGVECTLSKSADTKPEGVSDSPKGHTAIQRAPDSLERWDDKKPHEVQQEMLSPAPGEEQPQALGHAGCNPDGKQLCREDLGVQHQVEQELAMCSCCLKANGILGCIRQSTTSKSRAVPSHLFNSCKAMSGVLSPVLDVPV